MFLDPGKLDQASPAEILDAASRGHLGLDHRFLRALLSREEQSIPAVRAFANRDRSKDAVDLAPEIIALFRAWNLPDAIPFLISYIKEDPENVPDEIVESLVALGQPALEPLLTLYGELDEAEAGDVAFILANLHIHDARILRLLTDRMVFDLSDTALLLGIYGDAAAVPDLEAASAKLSHGDAELEKELDETITALKNPPKQTPAEPPEAFDIWALYPETDSLPMDLLDEDDRFELMTHPLESVRAAAMHSFFNQELMPEGRKQILALAQSDSSMLVRARAWEALINSTDETEVIDAMLAALRNPELSLEERGGLLVGLAPEADRNEVRQAMTELYSRPLGRAKALEAMWRSMHPSFRDNFAKHLDDADLEIKRGAIWGVGYYGLKSELERLRKFFFDEELRSDALFAYSLVLPSDVSRGRMKGLLTRIEKDAKGLSEMEEELVKAALDERLMLAGKEPVFREQED